MKTSAVPISLLAPSAALPFPSCLENVNSGWRPTKAGTRRAQPESKTRQRSTTARALDLTSPDRNSPPARRQLVSGRWPLTLRAGHSCLRFPLATSSSRGLRARPRRITTAILPPLPPARLLRHSARPAASTRRAAAAVSEPERSARALGATLGLIPMETECVSTTTRQQLAGRALPLVLLYRPRRSDESRREADCCSSVLL